MPALPHPWYLHPVSVFAVKSPLGRESSVAPLVLESICLFQYFKTRCPHILKLLNLSENDVGNRSIWNEATRSFKLSWTHSPLCLVPDPILFHPKHKKTESNAVWNLEAASLVPIWEIEWINFPVKSIQKRSGIKIWVIIKYWICEYYK